MPSLAAALAAAAVLAPAITAQDTSSDHTYTVWSSVIFSRTGERTPSIFYNELPKLTSLGATQQFANGAYFRERYIGSSGSSDGNVSAPLAGLSVDELDDIQLYVLALDQAYNVASAQAFMQGFYPPYVGNETTEAVNSTGDVSSVSIYLNFYEWSLQPY